MGHTIQTSGHRCRVTITGRSRKEDAKKFFEEYRSVLLAAQAGRTKVGVLFDLQGLTLHPATVLFLVKFFQDTRDVAVETLYSSAVALRKPQVPVFRKLFKMVPRGPDDVPMHVGSLESCLQYMETQSARVDSRGY